MQEPHKHLLELGLSDSEATVYLAMVSGVHRPRDLVKVTQIKRPTVYYALGCLEKRGLVSRTGRAGDNAFSLEPLEKLSIIAKEQALESSKREQRIESLVTTLAASYSPSNDRPAVAFYEGVDAVKSTIMEMMYSKTGHINSVVPKQNFFWQVGQEFVEFFIEERLRRGITTRNLWEAPVNKDLMAQYYEGVSEVRILPKVMHGKFHTTIFIYDDKTVYVSSKKQSYCVVITSQEHADTMQAWFEGLWVNSKKA
jgi:sugar-specific transcriptional regulator TrmB